MAPRPVKTSIGEDFIPAPKVWDGASDKASDKVSDKASDGVCTQRRFPEADQRLVWLTKKFIFFLFLQMSHATLERYSVYGA
jgi:hypothetical protein